MPVDAGIFLDSINDFCSLTTNDTNTTNNQVSFKPQITQITQKINISGKLICLKT